LKISKAAINSENFELLQKDYEFEKDTNRLLQETIRQLQGRNSLKPKYEDDALKKKIVTLEETIDALKQKILTLEETIDALKKKIVTFEDDAAKQAKVIRELRLKAEIPHESIRQYEENIGSLKKTNVKLEDDIAKQTKANQELQNKMQLQKGESEDAKRKYEETIKTNTVNMKDHIEKQVHNQAIISLGAKVSEKEKKNP